MRVWPALQGNGAETIWVARRSHENGEPQPALELFRFARGPDVFVFHCDCSPAAHQEALQCYNNKNPAKLLL